MTVEFKTKKPRTPEAQNVALSIADIRRNNGEPRLRPHEIDEAVAYEIKRYLDKIGSFYHDDTNHYYFSKGNLISLAKDNEDVKELLFVFGINPEHNIYKVQVAYLQLFAKQGEKITAKKLAHYDRETNTLYVNDNANGIYKVTADKISHVPNGSDGVLFLKDRGAAPFKRVPVTDPELFDVVFTKSLTNLDSQGCNLSALELQRLYVYWIQSMFFGSILPTRPILTCIGEGGSGKSSLLRKIGLMLYGKDFQVSGLNPKESDFDVRITNNHFVAIDNADSKCDYIEDKLAISATGGCITKRKLYNDNTNLEYKIDCFIGITSRTPHFKREDVSQRLLIFKLEKLKPDTLVPDDALQDSVLSKRNELMSHLLNKLQAAVKALAAPPDKNWTTSFRMADFARFCVRLGESKDTFDKMTVEQTTFTMEDDPLEDVILLWLKTKGNVGREVTAKILHGELEAVARASGKIYGCKNSKSLGHKIKALGCVQHSLIKIAVAQDTHTKKAIYRFTTVEI